LNLKEQMEGLESQVRGLGEMPPPSSPEASAPAGPGQQEFDRLSAELTAVRELAQQSADENTRLSAELEALKSASPAAAPAAPGDLLASLADAIDAELQTQRNQASSRLMNAFGDLHSALDALDAVASGTTSSRFEAIRDAVTAELNRELSGDGAEPASLAARLSTSLEALALLSRDNEELAKTLRPQVRSLVRQEINDLLTREDRGPQPLVAACEKVTDAVGLTLVYPDPGTPFDPVRYRMEGMESGSGLSPDQVFRVLEPGYREGERVIQPARVMVTK